MLPSLLPFHLSACIVYINQKIYVICFLIRAFYCRVADVSVNKRKRDPSSCPICGLTISQSDLQTHFMHELERLYKLSGTGIVAGRKRRADSRRSPVLPGDSGPEGRWEVIAFIYSHLILSILCKFLAHF